ncbi:flagellar motor switch protein FliM [Natranaerovirga hydrolytica]|uniref:Flagellar motor switch protein FliM n=1 Tax=Natranaerovirga hydrolytica TaxID=680378 RepID=A0A4V2Q1J8_9FIRM|nr:flagellar motor switch protein FliM [Natranaerovirga hydrolytica]TCK97901.1 flagellar motor switch protein FliM [Natranaerovirga hydrolytica]
MGEILSQNEIDSLLNALDTGELDADEYRKHSDEKKIKDYDFARPSKFSKEHLRTLEIIFEHYSRLIATALPGYLRSSVQVEVINSEAVSYSEFSNALANPVLLGIIDFSPLKGNIIIDFSVNIGYAIIDRMLGGTGKPIEKNRDFSEIERILLEKIFTVAINELREPWANVIRLEPHLEKLETNSQFAQIISPNEMIALITLSVKIGKVEGLMNICLPYICIEPIMDKLNTKYWFSRMQKKEADENYKEAIETLIEKAKVPIRVTLGNSNISVNDFVNLQKGDIIKLDTKIDKDLDVYVGNIKKFTAKPGKFKETNAVQITSIFREED